MIVLVDGLGFFDFFVGLIFIIFLVGGILMLYRILEAIAKRRERRREKKKTNSEN